MDVKNKSTLRDAMFIASNLYHLPFSESSFSCIVMIRVFNFVSQPLHVFKELSRILVPGGFLLLSINPKPSIATLVDDIKYHFTQSRLNSRKVKSVTFSRSNISEVHPASSPTFAFKRNFIKQIVNTNDFSQRIKISSGLEDYSLMDRLPLKFFLKVGTMFNFFPGFPTSFFLLQKKQDKVDPINDIHHILKCPKCGSNLITQYKLADLKCRECYSVYIMDKGILDMTYIPNDAKIAEEGEWVLRNKNRGIVK
jgi:SAM-dependent methyltransferase